MDETYRFSSPFRSAEYRFNSEGVEVTVRKFGKLTRVSVPFDQIPVRSSLATYSSKALGWATVVFAVLFVILAFAQFYSAGSSEPEALFVYGGLCIACAAAYFMTRTTSEVFMFGSDHISFFRRAKEDPSLTAFLQSMQRKKIDFFKKRIARRATEVPPDELSRYLLYLRESDLVDEPGYEELKGYFDELSDHRSRIGFNKDA